MGSLLPRLANGNDDGSSTTSGFFGWLKRFFKTGNGENSARDVLEELIEEREECEVPINDEERLLLANILELKDRTIHDVMVPRADIISVDSDINLSDVIKIITCEGHSRIPVFRGSLDDAIGMIHQRRPRMARKG